MPVAWKKLSKMGRSEKLTQAVQECLFGMKLLLKAFWNEHFLNIIIITDKRPGIVGLFLWFVADTLREPDLYDK